MIDDKNLTNRIRQCFSFLQGTTDQQFSKVFFRNAQLVRVESAQPLLAEGDRCDTLALVLSGNIRIFKLTQTGREMTLYRVSSGDSCILTASCILSNTTFPAMAVAESALELVLIPADLARDWLSSNKAWCMFIFGLVAKRLATVIMTLESVAFQKMNARLANYLIGQADASGHIALTHQEIADDLGTSREVVTRLLKEFHAAGHLSTGRGHIELIHPQALSQFAQEI